MVGKFCDIFRENSYFLVPQGQNPLKNKRAQTLLVRCLYVYSPAFVFGSSDFYGFQMVSIAVNHHLQPSRAIQLRKYVPLSGLLGTLINEYCARKSKEFFV